MKRLAAFLKATTLGGLFVLLPVVVVFGLLAKTVLGVRDTAHAIMVKFTGQHSEADQFPLLVAVLIVVAVSFFLGLIMVTKRGKASGRWIERTLLFGMPGYMAIRALIGGFSRPEEEGSMKAGLMTVDPGIQCLVLITENHGNDLLTIYIPGSPNPASGSVQIVRSELVMPLRVKINDVAGALQQWGVGTAKLLSKHSTAESL